MLALLRHRERIGRREVYTVFKMEVLCDGLKGNVDVATVILIGTVDFAWNACSESCDSNSHNPTLVERIYI